MDHFHPSDEQERVIGHDLSRSGVILAGPGTGKSVTVVALLERLMGQDPKPAVRLLTFTRAATSELAGTVSRHPSLTALRPSTIHSFAISALLRNPGAANYPEPLRIADKWEQREIVRRTLARRMGARVSDIDALIRELESNWQALVPEQVQAISEELRLRFLGTWDEHRRIYGYTMLAELPNLLREALRDHDNLVAVKYDLLIVDEYQDLNACDIELIQRLAALGCAVVAAGDDEQSLYSFRKAAPEGIRRFTDDYPGAVEYPLSLTRRCATSIVSWARSVIESDPDRPPSRPHLTPVPDAPTGEVGLLAFGGQAAEARGIADLAHHLITGEGIAPAEILVLLRGDRNGVFSKPIKAAMAAKDIAVADPDYVERALSDSPNRRSLALLRLLELPEDSLSWATLLELEAGVGTAFTDYVYHRALERRVRFGHALLSACDEGLPGAPPGSGPRARQLVAETRKWLVDHGRPDAPPEDGWGHWIAQFASDSVFPGFSQELAELLIDLDAVVEVGTDLSRYLSQVGPLGSDIAAARAGGVRIMSMTKSKGLTVQATIVAACEDNVNPAAGLLVG